VERKDLKIKLELWDTAGQEKFRHIAPIYFRKSSAVLIVYDISNKKSFSDAELWLSELDDYVGVNCMKYLVGNKFDREDERYTFYLISIKFCKIDSNFEFYLRYLKIFW